MNDSSLIQKTYTAVLRHFMAFGRAPHYTELAGILNLSPEEARQTEHKTAEAALACWFMPETDYVESWAPFSNIPTHYLISVDGEQRWYGQWGLESLAVRWLFPGREVRIDTRCLDCGQPVVIRMMDNKILEIDPDTTVGHLNTAFSKALSGEVSWGMAWSRMNLFRSEEHVKAWPQYETVSEQSIMPVSNWAETFGGPLFRKRLEHDYLSHMHDYASEMIGTLQKFGKSGTFWVPG